MRVLVFGASGALGSAITNELKDYFDSVVTVSRSNRASANICLADDDWVQKATAAGKIDAVIWAQGINSNGTVPDIDPQSMRDAYEANVVFIVETLNALLLDQALSLNARCVVLSSIWQEFARPNKLAYVASKSALDGLLKALAIDLAPQGISLNAVLPGVIDTPMTRANLSEKQIESIQNATPMGQLANAEDVARTVRWLASPDAKGITGQWVTVDNGWSVYRNV